MVKTRSQHTLIGRNKNPFYWLIGEGTKLQRRTQLQRYRRFGVLLSLAGSKAMGCHYRQNSAIVVFVNGASNFVYGAFVFINGASVFVNGASNFVYGAFVFINGASVFVNGASNFVYGAFVFINGAFVFVNGASNIQQSGKDSLVT